MCTIRRVSRIYCFYFFFFLRRFLVECRNKVGGGTRMRSNGFRARHHRPCLPTDGRNVRVVRTRVTKPSRKNRTSFSRASLSRSSHSPPLPDLTYPVRRPIPKPVRTVCPPFRLAPKTFSGYSSRFVVADLKRIQLPKTAMNGKYSLTRSRVVRMSASYDMRVCARRRSISALFGRFRHTRQ